MNNNINSTSHSAPRNINHARTKSAPEHAKKEAAPKKEEYQPLDQYIDASDLKLSAEDKEHGHRMVSDFVWKADKPVVTEFEIQPKTGKAKNDPNIINIIHTNDLHGNLDPNHGKGGMAYVAGKIDQLRTKDPDHLVLDGGDMAYSPPYSDRNRFNPMPTIMNTIGYDAMVTGNHEFQYEADKYGGPEGNPNAKLTDNLKELQEHTNFPMLCANAIRKDIKGRPDYIKPYIIKKVGNVNVGVIGVVTKKMATSAHPQVAAGWNILDQADSINQFVPEMKEKGADIVVVISHDSLGRNESMISRSHGIDMVVGGHDHQTTESPRIIRNADGQKVPLVEAGAHGYMIGNLKVEVDPDSKKVEKITSTLYPVQSSKIKPDPEVEAIVNKWLHRE